MKTGISIGISLFMSVFALGQQDPSGYGIDTTDSLPVGIALNAMAPIILTNDIAGGIIDTDALLKNGPVVVLFYRGAWCPVCNRYLSELNESLSEIKEKGAVVLAISPELTENAHLTQDSTRTDFIFISDTTLQIAKDFKVLFQVTDAYSEKISRKFGFDIAENNGQKKAQLPVPATFIIGVDGRIKYKQFDLNYKKRASAEDILTALNALD